MFTSGSTKSVPASTELALPTISPPGVTSARSPSSWDSTRLHDRDEVVRRVVEVCTDPSGAPIVAITGPAGIGRSCVLGAVRSRLCDRAIPTVGLRLARDGADVGDLAGRLAAELGVPAHRVGSARDLMQGVLNAAAEHDGRLVVFLDDAQRIGRECVDGLVGLLGSLGGRVVCVCAFRTPVAAMPSGRAWPRRLVHEERLRPLGKSAIRSLLIERLRVRSAVELVEAVYRASRGIPAFVHAAVDGYLTANVVQVVDRHALLVGRRSPHVSSEHPVFAGLRELGSPLWPVVKAFAVLHPLRGPVVALIADASDVDENRVTEAMRMLNELGILVPGRRVDGWRFRVPVLATLLTACLGPYEKRRVSAVAATALWDGTASCDNPRYLPDLLVGAGRLVDQERAASELLVCSATADSDDADAADRWGRAASKLISDRTRRAALLHRHAVRCAVHHRYESATDIADELLRADSSQLPASSLRELQLLWIVGAASSGKLSALRHFLDGAHQLVPGAPEHRTVARVTALCLLGRWARAREELDEKPEQCWEVETEALTYRKVLRAAVDLAFGMVSTMDCSERLPEGGEARPRGTAADVLLVLTRSLIPSGWVHPSEALTRREPATEELAVHAGFSGRCDDSLALGRSSIARASACGGAPGLIAVFRCMADVFVARGQLRRARDVLTESRAQHLLLPHLLAVPEAAMECVLGDHQRARERVAQALGQATGDGVPALAGTDELLLWMAEFELLRGNRAAAEDCVARIGRIAARLDTVESRRHELLARVLVRGDSAAATEVIELEQERGRPHALARTLTTVSRSGYGGRKLMYRAYELLGELDAVLARAKLRLLMRERGFTVPGRRETVREKERLLAMLIAEGLSNARLAIILGTTEKGIEGRLTRLFQRTGFQSRAELAAASLNGFSC